MSYYTIHGCCYYLLRFEFLLISQRVSNERNEWWQISCAVEIIYLAVCAVIPCRGDLLRSDRINHAIKTATAARTTAANNIPLRKGLTRNVSSSSGSSSSKSRRSRKMIACRCRRQRSNIFTKLIHKHSNIIIFITIFMRIISICSACASISFRGFHYSLFFEHTHTHAST